MFSASKLVIGMVVALVAASYASAAKQKYSPHPLTVCADPANLPFSNDAEQGFENQLAKLVAHDLHRPLAFAWAPQRGEFLKKTLNAGKCDLVMGLPSSTDDAQPTIPYYRSSFVFVSRRDHPIDVRSFEDAALHNARIGVQIMQHEAAVAPPAQVLISHGLADNISWFRLFPDFSRPNPTWALIEAVEKGEIDAAVSWGPIAGYFAKHAAVPLLVTPVPHSPDADSLSFDISMAARSGDATLVSELNAVIAKRRARIHAILDDYGVPQSSLAAHLTTAGR